MIFLEYWRSFDPAQHETARACAERVIAEVPTSSQGYQGRSLVYYRAFLLDITTPGEPPAIDLALHDALKADALKPDVARTEQLLFTIWFSRGDLAQAFAAADKAMALKPHDPIMTAEYGARLVAMGQLDRGMPMLREAAELMQIRPVSINFHLFLGAYLADDRAQAPRYAVLIENEPSPFGLLARALSARMNGDREKGTQAIDRLVALSPGWGTDPRRQLAKFFPVAELRDRLLRDLDEFGLHQRETN
jgi:tetratricopeptide (TPR) repeat protein